MARRAPSKREPSANAGEHAPESDSMRAWLEDSLQDLPRFAIRRMFGGAGLYAGDVMFGILYRARVYLKTDDATRVAYTDRDMEAFRVRQGTVLTKYYEVPPAVLADETELSSWCRRALAVAEAAPPTRQRPRRRRAQ
jgi:DNA transformation protein